MRVGRTALLAGSVIALSMYITPAANAADTIVTFTVSSGALTISAPAGPVSLGSGSPGTTFGAIIGTVTVTDARGLNPSSWTSTVAASAFTATGVPAIPSSALFYEPGSATTNGNGTLTAGTNGVMTNTRTAYSYAGGTGSSTTSWTPDIDVTVPNTATATTYTGEVTHSVA
jgi:hypothetical protein